MPPYVQNRSESLFTFFLEHNSDDDHGDHVDNHDDDIDDQVDDDDDDDDKL